MQIAIVLSRVKKYVNYITLYINQYQNTNLLKKAVS